MRGLQTCNVTETYFSRVSVVLHLCEPKYCRHERRLQYWLRTTRTFALYDRSVGEAISVPIWDIYARSCV